MRTIRRMQASSFRQSLQFGRPLDEYSLKIDVMKLTLNEAFEADQFVLTIPPGTTVQKLQ